MLYKLLNYFPIKETELDKKKYDTPIKDLLVKLKDGNSVFNREIRKFYNFITTLPSREDFSSQIRILIDNYDRQRDPEYHLEKITFAHNISLILAKIRECISKLEEKSQIDLENIEIIRERWFELLNFLNPILKFSITFGEFLLPFAYYRLYNKVENSDMSLRGMVGFNEDLIFSLNESFSDIKKLKILEKNILRIQSDFKVGSDFHALINNTKSNLEDLAKALIKQISDLPKQVIVNNLTVISPEYMTKIPQIYSTELILKELTTNMKNHSKKGTQVIFDALKEDNYIKIKITNTQSKTKSNNSNGEGIKCLTLLKESDFFGFSYNNFYEGEHFIQELKFLVN